MTQGCRLDSAACETTISTKYWEGLVDRVCRHEIDENAKTLRLWVWWKRGNRKLICVPDAGESLPRPKDREGAAVAEQSAVQQAL